MLCLSRKRGQVITIGPDIQITVLELNGYQVRLGIEAPADVPVHRLEIAERIKQQEERE